MFPLWLQILNLMHYTFLFFTQAAEQAKASPALVAKDPGIVANKKEEEDLAKGKLFIA